MSTLLATTAIPSATVAALGRLHSNNRSSGGSSSGSSSGSSTSNKISGRQRSSSLTIRTATIVTPTDTTSSATPSPILTSRRLPSTTSQGESPTETRGPSWALPSMRKSSSSRNNPAESAAIATPPRDRAHQQQSQGTDGLGRINLVPLSGANLGNSTNDHEPSKVYSGRSRSNTLTGLGSSVNGSELASVRLDHGMRPRRSSITGKPPVPIVTLSQPPYAPANSHSSHLRYPPSSTLPQYRAVAIADGDDDDDTATIGNSLSTDEKPKPFSSSTLSSWVPSWVSQIRLGFLPRIIILISLFGLSLGGLYLLAQVLPPLSLPKSIDDVKVDAAILQDFATATYEGWMRTFWVFCVVYVWKQCFGIPGSAFLNILAGALYGPWFGTLLTSALTTLGSLLAYFMSYFLMEPILSRYASTRLDQMRLQIQKADRSSSKPFLSSPSSTSTTSTTTTAATSTAVQTLHATPSIPLSGTTTNHFSPPSTRGMLRTRSSSFTGRRPESDNATLQQPPQFNRLLNITSVDEIEILENDRPLNETNPSKPKPNANYPDFASQQGPDTNSDSDTVVEEADHENKDEDENEDEEEQGPSLFMQLLLIRLFPLTPYWFINLASPLVGVPVMPFVTSMFLGCMPYNYICAQAGAILGEIHQMSDIYQQPWILFQIIFVLVLSAGATWASKRWTRKQQQKDDQRQQNGGGNGRSHKSRDSDEEDGDEEESSRGLLQHRQDQEEGSHRLSTDSISIPMGIMGHDQYSDTGRNTQRHDSAIVDMNFYRH